MLCSESNRFILPGSPSTCALDTSITPIPSFLLLAFLVVYIPTRLFLKQRSSFSSSSSSISSTSKPSFSAYNYSSPSESPPLRILSAGLPRWVHYTYIALVVCLLALRVLEVARLAAADMGVALLPVGVIAGMALIVMLAYGGCGMGKSRSAAVSTTLVLYWAASTVLESVKVARLSSYFSLHTAKGTAYPSSDWLLDNGCMLGLLVIFFFVEGTYLVLRWRSATFSRMENDIEPVREKEFRLLPRPVSEYDSVTGTYLDQRTAGIVV